MRAFSSENAKRKLMCSSPATCGHPPEYAKSCASSTTMQTSTAVEQAPFPHAEVELGLPRLRELLVELAVRVATVITGPSVTCHLGVRRPGYLSPQRR